MRCAPAAPPSCPLHGLPPQQQRSRKWRRVKSKAAKPEHGPGPADRPHYPRGGRPRRELSLLCFSRARLRPVLRPVPNRLGRPAVVVVGLSGVLGPVHGPAVGAGHGVALRRPHVLGHARRLPGAIAAAGGHADAGIVAAATAKAGRLGPIAPVALQRAGASQRTHARTCGHHVAVGRTGQGEAGWAGSSPDKEKTTCIKQAGIGGGRRLLEPAQPAAVLDGPPPPPPQQDVRKTRATTHHPQPLCLLTRPAAPPYPPMPRPPGCWDPRPPKLLLGGYPPGPPGGPRGAPRPPPAGLKPGPPGRSGSALSSCSPCAKLHLSPNLRVRRTWQEAHSSVAGGRGDVAS